MKKYVGIGALVVLVGAIGAYTLWPASAPLGLYCEGGVVDGQSDGGACFDFTATKLDASPESVGSGRWSASLGGDSRGGDSGATYGVRRAGSSTFDLYRNGVKVGSFERSGRWVHVTFGEGKKVSLRSDRAGLMI